jgi:hypothetical protein
MYTFFKKLLFFIIPLLVIFVACEVYLRTIDSTYKLKINGLLKDKDKIELLILGNSHATYSVDPNQFDYYAYNLAEPAQSIYFDKRITLKHLNELKNLKYVLISVDYHSLYFSSQDIRNQWAYYGYGINYKNSIPISSKISYLEGYTIKVLASNIKKRILNFDKNVKLNAIDIDKGVNLYKPISKGWFSLSGIEFERMNINSYKERAQNFNAIVKNSKESKQVIQDLEGFIVQLKSKNIQPILFNTPCYYEYNQFLNKDYLATNDKIINDICTKYSLQYLSYWNYKLDKKYFFNCDHLNKDGAVFFSKMLNKKVNELYKK